MKSNSLISIVTLLIILSNSCSKLSEDGPQLTFDNRIMQETQLFMEHNPLTLTYRMKDGGEALQNLIESKTWKMLPNDVSSRLKFTSPVILTDYYSTEVQSISFDLYSDKIQESLVFYHLKGEYIPVLTISSKKGKLVHHCVTDLAQDVYFDFYVDRSNRMGHFKVHNNMPVFLREYSDAKEIAGPEGTCMEQTDNFGDCLLCALAECAEDWICTIAFTFNSKGMLAAFGIVCLIDNIV